MENNMSFVYSKRSFYAILFLFLTLPSYSENFSCDELNGQWQGSYQEKTNLYGQSGPWPISFSIKYDAKTKIFNGIADTPLIPSSVSLEGEIHYIQTEPGKIIGVCQNNKIEKLLVYYSEKHCGHYTTPGGKLGKKNLSLNFDYEFSMNEAKFSFKLVKINNKMNETNFEFLPFKKLPTIKSCH